MKIQHSQMLFIWQNIRWMVHSLAKPSSLVLNVDQTDEGKGKASLFVIKLKYNEAVRSDSENMKQAQHKFPHFLFTEAKLMQKTSRIHSRGSFSQSASPPLSPPPLTLSPPPSTLILCLLTSHVHPAIIMKLKPFSTADVCPGNNHTEIGFIHLAF